MYLGKKDRLERGEEVSAQNPSGEGGGKVFNYFVFTNACISN